MPAVSVGRFPPSMHPPHRVSSGDWIYLNWRWFIPAVHSGKDVALSAEVHLPRTFII
jgi:hypothetical protein